MKRKYIILLVVNLVFVSFLSSSCDKYTDCTGIITVMQSHDGNSAISDPVPGCTVYVGEKEYAENVYFVGTTDEKGQIKNVWKNEANLGIKAVKGDMTAIGVINLKAGEVVEQTVWLKKNI
jgi:hypothetical protein